MSYEDRPEKDTPVKILESLREYGGESPFGDSIWRFVRAENVRIHCFGWRNEIAEGTKQAAMNADATPKEDGFASRETRTVQPARVIDGEHWISRYSFSGWILERWYPASTWGSKAQWESEKARDDRTRMLAAYPQKGAYVMMPCGPFKTIEDAGDLTRYIRNYNLQQRMNPVNFDNEIERLAKIEESERQTKADLYAEEMSAQYREAFSGAVRSVSESAQVLRNNISAHTAGGVNLGASEKWG